MVGLRGFHGDLHRITFDATNIDYNLLLILTTVSGQLPFIDYTRSQLKPRVDSRARIETYRAACSLDTTA